MTAEEVRELERRVAAGCVALFPADTVYGLAADPESAAAVERLYELKGRPADRPAAVMFFDLELALAALDDLPVRTREALERLLPGPVTAVVPNPQRRYPLACGPAPERLGVRVPKLTGALAPLGAIRRPVLQSSANRSGSPDARTLDQVPAEIRAGVSIEVDAGELPGVPSTVVDLADYHEAGGFEVLREGALTAEQVHGFL